MEEKDRKRERKREKERKKGREGGREGRKERGEKVCRMTKHQSININNVCKGFIKKHCT